MEYVYLGKIANTHGIKGEIKILSNFDKKDLVFKSGFKVYIGDLKTEEIINSYRHHQIFDMITLEGYSNINEVLKYKGLNIYINRDDLNLNKNDYILEDLIGLNIKCGDETLGKVVNFMNNTNNVLLEISYDKNYYIPLVDEYIVKVDLENKVIETKNVKGLIL